MITSLLNPILHRFAEQFPIPTMARAVLERHVSVARLLALRQQADYRRNPSPARSAHPTAPISLAADHAVEPPLYL